MQLHASGVDITFESQEDHYRASFLIREFSVSKLEEECPNSTFIYDYMFPYGISSETMAAIRWERFDKPKSNKQPRQFHRKGTLFQTSNPIDNQIGATVSREFMSSPEALISRLSFSHIRELLTIDDPLVRYFYEQE